MSIAQALRWDDRFAGTDADVETAKIDKVQNNWICMEMDTEWHPVKQTIFWSDQGMVDVVSA